MPPPSTAPRSPRKANVSSKPSSIPPSPTLIFEALQDVRQNGWHIDSSDDVALVKLLDALEHLILYVSASDGPSEETILDAFPPSLLDRVRKPCRTRKGSELTVEKLHKWLLNQLPADVAITHEAQKKARRQYLYEIFRLRNENAELGRKLEESDKRSEVKLSPKSPARGVTQEPDFDGVKARLATFRGELRSDRKDSAALRDASATPFISRLSPARKKYYVFRITQLTTSLPVISIDDEIPVDIRERSTHVYDGFQGVFVTVPAKASLKDVEAEFLLMLKESDPENVEILNKVQSVVFKERNGGPVVRERGWEIVKEVLHEHELQARIYF